MKKLTIIVTFLVTLLLVTPFVFASSGAPTMIEGASIRTSGEQGLRFYANLENEAVTSQGFYLVYGETSVVNLQTAISNAVEDNVMLNVKKVFKVEVENREPNGDFSVVLTGIPEVGYLDKITAIAYGVVDNAEIFVSAGTTRSIGEVAYNMIKANDYNQVALDILESIDINHRALVSTHWETYEESSAIFETDPLILKTQFINDWNAKFGTTLTDLIGTAFHTSAIVGKTDQAAQGSMTNLTGMRIYAFFKDELYSLKWGWLLDYIIKYGSGIIHPARQAVALKGDGTNNNQILYDASHFNYSLVNFFNMSNQTGGYEPINFTLPGSKARYQDVVNFNNTIPKMLSIYNLSKIGDSVALPQDLSKDGYTFNQSFTEGTNVHTISYILTGQGKVLEPNFTIVNYNISYLDGAEEVLPNDLYNINQSLTLPTYEKPDHIFEGWFDNPSFTGSPVTSISMGTTGNKVFYAKTSLLDDPVITSLISQLPTHIMNDYVLPNAEGVTWQLKAGQDTTLYNVETGKLLRFPGESTLLTVVLNKGSISQDVVLRFGIADPTKTQYYYNADANSVAQTGGTFTTQQNKSGFGGYTIIVGTKQYFIGYRSHISLSGTTANEIMTISQLRPYGLGGANNYNLGLLTGGIPATNSRGYGVLYENTGNVPVQFDLRETYGRADSGYAGYGKFILKPEGNGQYKVSALLPNHTGGLMVTLNQGELLWAPHTWEVAGTYLYQPGATKGVLLVNSIIKIETFKMDFTD
ncbi:InlB B-repeat-containing protein [Acholeplasma laidlawii]|uniref:InlB B-repeat-containing protein n=1 Tax=Acholeplasma laidlawii TaxID=2148 RepID=A0A553IJJ9_ACHLA|nr:InlB B-repeat-containing protein [Acholeplasma laidlawii]NWH10635.1 InlB B-repeat-containing protein [Acholeplasma laidlawii]NWH12020.1 InlB B-repeat-containing protein [Acholeplasma laidlawii]NWH12571.1 InlB B-repeat-containing protein [Acholeplasma laidlawii]NWH14795.1 InlB B-repeat-containing protein [Acholeplasma laidlawii]OAN18861.1 hypothetical protein A2I99_06515 [Acholeplasma laidlawii]